VTRTRIAAHPKSLEVGERVEAWASGLAGDAADLAATDVRVERSDLDSEVPRGGARVDPARIDRLASPTDF